MRVIYTFLQYTRGSHNSLLDMLPTMVHQVIIGVKKYTPGMFSFCTAWIAYKISVKEITTNPIFIIYHRSKGDLSSTRL